MTSVNFNLDQGQPSQANPIGNPDFPGVTSSILANWAGFLTGTYNTSFIRTIDLAGGGATVDGNLFKSAFPGFRSFHQQAVVDFIPKYAEDTNSDFQWKRDDSLFVSFFGLNDVRGAYFQNKQNLLTEDIDRYVEILRELYSAGARNFLVLQLSPLERAPNANWNDEHLKQELGDLITGYNTNLTRAVTQFSDDNSDAAVFIFDTHELFNKLLDDPCSYPETCPIKVTDAFCPAYENERSNPYVNNSSCAYPLDEYFWINGLHPL